VEFLDNKTTMVAVQLADLMAGAARFILSEPENPVAAQFESLIEPRFIENCIYPQSRYIDTDLPQTDLNIAVLYELGRRARERHHPLHRIYQAEIVSEKRTCFSDRFGLHFFQYIPSE
jgi:hypothetical protein